MTIQLTVNFKAVLAGVVMLALMMAVAVPYAVSRAEGDDPSPSTRAAVSNGFTFQGRFEQDGVPANGSFTFRFTLRSDAAANATVGSPIQQALTVTDGLFSTALDFGPTAFDGQARWLDVEVNPGSGFVALPPRQALTATPYALFALNTGPHDHIGESWQSPGIGATGLTITATDYNSTALKVNNTGNCGLAGRVCYAVWGKADAFGGGNGFGGVGVRGDGTNGGVLGTGPQYGVYGDSAGVGVVGASSTGDGISGISSADSSSAAAVRATAVNDAYGIRVEAQSGIGVHSTSDSSVAVFGEGSTGLQGYTNKANGLGVHGVANVTNGRGVVGFASATGSTGVQGTGTSKGVWGIATGTGGYAGYFEGNVFSSTGVYASSDLRLKHDVRNLETALSTVMALRPVRYQYNASDGEHIGLIAQEVQAVLPELVTVDGTTEEGMLALNYTELIPVLIKAIQELQAEVEELKAR